MRGAWIGLLTAALAAGGLVAGVRADEEKVPLDKLPQAVAAAVKNRFPDAELKGASKEEEKGQTIYEVAIRHKGQSMDISLTPTGTITEIEKSIEAKAMPRAVKAALTRKYPQATYQKIEEVIKVKGRTEKLEYYEVVLTTAGKKKLEVAVTPEGKLTGEEDKSKEKD